MRVRTLILAALCAAGQIALAGCGSKSVADWLQNAGTVDEVYVVNGCTIVADNLDRALAHRRSDSLIGGDFAKLEPEKAECGRYVLYSTVLSGPDAVVTLERGTDGGTNITVYQHYGDSYHSRRLVRNVESWANGFVTAE